MIRKQLNEASSWPGFSFSRKTKNLLNSCNSLISGTILMVALLLSFGSNAQTLGSIDTCDLNFHQDVLNQIDEYDDFSLAYSFEVPNSAIACDDDMDFVNANPNLDLECFNKVAYLVILRKDRPDAEKRWVWVSMDAFTNDLDELSVPGTDADGNADFVWQQPVNNLNVVVNEGFSNVNNPGDITSGNLEIWPYGYTKGNGNDVPGASDSLYDWGDTFMPQYCFGSFQVHDNSSQVIFAFNAWRNKDGYIPSLGIGNNGEGPSTNGVDYTFSNNAGELDIKCVYIFVGGTEEVPDCALIATDEVHLHGDNDVIGNVCVTDENGDIKLHDESHVDGAVKADEVDIDNDSSAGSIMEMPADVEIPQFYYNTLCDDASIEVVVDKDDTVELTGNNYKRVEIKEGATVTFTQENIFICELKTDKGVTLNFAECANLIIDKDVEFDEYTNFNPQMNQVSMFVDGNVRVKKGSSISSHIHVNDNVIKTEGDDGKEILMKGVFIAKKIEGKHTTWQGNGYCDPCPVEVPPTVADCECDGGINEVTFSYPGELSDLSTDDSDATITDNGDGTFTIASNDGGKLSDPEIFVNGISAGEFHASCSDNLLEEYYSEGIVVVEYIDVEGSVISIETCPYNPPVPDCECKGGMVSVTFTYMGSETLSTNSGVITNNGDGTYTVSDNGEKLDGNLEIYVGGNTAEIHTSCSQDIVGVNFAGVTVIAHTDTEGNMTTLDGCFQAPVPDCGCEGGIVEVSFSYGGELSDLTTNDDNAFFTDNGDGTFTLDTYNGEKLSNPDIFVNGVDAGEFHSSCSQNLLENVYGQGIVVVEYVDEEGSVTSIETCPFDQPGQDCECDGGIVSITFEYPGELSDLSSNDSDATITDNGDGTFTIASNDGDKLNNPDMFINGTDVGELHASCSDNLLGVVLGDITVISYIDKEGGELSIETCPVECECSGGLLEVTFAYDGAGVPTSNSGSVTDNNDGTYTVYDNGVKLEKDLEITTALGMAEIHTSCSQDILGVTFSGGVTVIEHVDSNGSVCSINFDGGVKRQGAGTTSKGGDVKAQDELIIETPKVEFAVRSWPNPSQNDFNIRISTDNTVDPIKVQVFDITGKTVHIDSIDSNMNYRFGNELGSGLYFVKVAQGNNVKTLRLMKY
ncbi:MAG: T9SS type A sorting domain-containing protein [Flavobacteriaceae bacterium]|nr:T9SS type A sorting domain-containing protein [Flavobacteriaceae bacterium]